MAQKRQTPGGARLIVDQRSAVTRIEIDRRDIGECTQAQEEAVHALALEEDARLEAIGWESPFYAGMTVWLVSTPMPRTGEVLERLYAIESQP